MLAFFLAWILIMLMHTQPADNAPPRLTVQTALLYAVAAGALLLFAISMSMDMGLRRILAKTLFRQTAYDPDSYVHSLALILILFMLTVTYGGFILNNGLAGIEAETAIESQSAPDYAGFLENLGVYCLFSVLGVGLFTRRGIRATFQRLGVRLPGVGEWTAGLGIGLAMRIYTLLFSILIYFLLPRETYNSLWGVSISTHSTLLYGFLLALSSGIGEEILFRGALQPIFGVWLTSLVFVMVHTNYTFTLSWGIIGIHALIFAWLRRRTNTTTAMIAHFTYNFVPYLLGYLTSGMG